MTNDHIPEEGDDDDDGVGDDEQGSDGRSVRFGLVARSSVVNRVHQREIKVRGEILKDVKLRE